MRWSGSRRCTGRARSTRSTTRRRAPRRRRPSPRPSRRNPSGDEGESSGGRRGELRANATPQGVLLQWRAQTSNEHQRRECEMTPMLRIRLPHALGALAVGAALLAPIGLSGCDQSGDAGAVIRDASMRLEALSGGGASPAPWITDRLKGYAEVIADLKPVTEEGLPGQVAAARLLTARALAGQAQVKAEEAAGLGRTTVAKAGVVASALEQWLSAQSLAQSHAQYSPAEPVAELERADREKDEQIAAAVARKERTDQAIADLERRAEEALGRARGER